jgi:hypothetical protein
LGVLLKKVTGSGILQLKAQLEHYTRLSNPDAPETIQTIEARLSTEHVTSILAELRMIQSIENDANEIQKLQRQIGQLKEEKRSSEVASGERPQGYVQETYDAFVKAYNTANPNATQPLRGVAKFPFKATNYDNVDYLTYHEKLILEPQGRDFDAEIRSLEAQQATESVGQER